MGNSSARTLISHESDVNFGFGFNNADFSDRVLRLEISLASNENRLNDSECGSTFRVKTLHISSILFAAKSPFFYKLFNNGMRESHKGEDVTLRINASEEAGLMDVVNCIYNKPMKATTSDELLDVLIVADKFEVTSCMRQCIRLLVESPMSLESALSYLELSSSAFVGDVFEPLLDAAKHCIAGYFNEFTKSKQKEAMTLPLSALEVVLGSDGLKVDSEEAVFDFVLKWVRSNYPQLKERREILTKHLATRYIHFQYMSSSKLKEVVECPDLDYEPVSKRVLNALISEDQALPTTKCGCPRRCYKYRDVKVVQLECAKPRCLVYLSLKKQECADLYPSNKLYSWAFCFGGRYFFLTALCHQEQPSSDHRFGLFVHMKGSENCALSFVYAVMKKPTAEFQVQGTHSRYSFTLTATDNVRGSWMFNWTDLMRDGSEFFIDGVLHLQVQLTINN